MSLDIFSSDKSFALTLQSAGHQVSAGYPSPAEDYQAPTLELNQAIIKNPTSTFYGRVKGFSMKDAGIDDGDLLVIDKSLSYRSNALAVCFINGEFTLKRIKVEGKSLFLMPANEAYQPIEVKEEDEFTVWGIVTWVVKQTY